MGIGKKVASAAVGLATFAAGNLGGDNNIKDYVRAQKYSDSRNSSSLLRRK